MLGGQDVDRPDRSTKLLKLPNHRGELYGFGTGTDYRKNLQLCPLTRNKLLKRNPPSCIRFFSVKNVTCIAEKYRYTGYKKRVEDTATGGQKWLSSREG